MSFLSCACGKSELNPIFCINIRWINWIRFSRFIFGKVVTLLREFCHMIEMIMEKVAKVLSFFYDNTDENLFTSFYNEKAFWLLV